MKISSMIKDVEEHLHFCNFMVSCSLLPYLIQFKCLEPINPVLKCMEKTRWKCWLPTSSVQRKEQLADYNRNGTKWSTRSVRTSRQQYQKKWGIVRQATSLHGSSTSLWRVKWITRWCLECCFGLLRFHWHCQSAMRDQRGEQVQWNLKNQMQKLIAE